MENSRQIFWPLTGRSAEIGRFTSFLRESKSCVLFFTGPSGVGKTRIAEECLALAERGGWEVLQAAATSIATEIPLGALLSILPVDFDTNDPVTSLRAELKARSSYREDKTLLFVDDVHLLDSATLHLLHELANAKDFKLVMTIRSDVSAFTHKDVSMLLEHPAATICRVEEFTEADVEVLLSAVLEGPVHQRAVNWFHKSSDGNALFLQEVVLDAFARDQFVKPGRIWELREQDAAGATPRLKDLLRRRLAEVASDEKRLLEYLALCGETSVVDVAEEFGDVRLLDSLEAAGLVRVLRRHRRAAARLTHPLYAETIQNTVPFSVRSEILLRRVARVRRYGARRKGDALSIAGWEIAATGTTAPSNLVTAAHIARYGHDCAQVINLLRRLPEEEQSVQILCLLGEAYVELGQPGEAEQALSTAIDRALTDDERFTSYALGITNMFWGVGNFEESFELLTAARGQLDSEPYRRELDALEGGMRAFLGTENELAIRLLSSVSVEGDKRSYFTSKMFEGCSYANLGQFDKAIAIAEGAFAAHRESEHSQAASIQLIPLGLALMYRGELHKAREIVGDGLKRSFHDKAIIPEMWMCYILGWCSWVSGQPTTSSYWYETALSSAQLHHPSVARGILAGISANAALLGDQATAEERLAEAQNFPRIGALEGDLETFAQAWCAANLGKSEEALEVLRNAAARASETGRHAAESLLLTDIARLGAPQEVSGRLAELASLCDGPLAAVRARFASALASEDTKILEQVGHEFQGMGVMILAAEAFSTAATLSLRRGRRASAASYRDQSIALRAQCDNARTPLLTSGRHVELLTARETQIAVAAATGRSSKEIANDMAVSVRTVDNHLARVYEKLGIKRRTELAAALGHQN
ncbi:LuxR C-terminal-related transcriptional regulator [Streptomyces bobili]|uniref:LuxR C-terminal-related transcriptional regulator n=1 Tax=Streptomyces bobili TaxID=67280 RepID=UPI00380993B4